MASSWNGKTVKTFRDLGYSVEVVERYSPHSRRTHDLFGIIDVLAVGHGETIGIQVTSRGNMAARRGKMADPEYATDDLIAAGWALEVHGWDQPGGKGTRWRLHRQRWNPAGWDTISDSTP